MVVIGKSSRVQVSGPMEAYVAGFESELKRLGFTHHSAAAQVRLMAHVSRWLDARDLGVSDLTVELIEEFFDERRGRIRRLFLPGRCSHWCVGLLRRKSSQPRRLCHRHRMIHRC